MLLVQLEVKVSKETWAHLAILAHLVKQVQQVLLVLLERLAGKVHLVLLDLQVRLVLLD